jgi:signal peptidase I
MTHRAKSLWRVLIIAAIVFLLIKFVAVPRIVYGESMSPTLKSWELCVMQRVRHYEPRRGDIIEFRTADDPPLYFVKRVIALPGETVAIEHGIFKINGAPLAEPYTTPNPNWQMDPIPLPAGKIFVVGDNRDFDLEDYVKGPVATRLVQSRMIWHWRWKR